jgi:hypothetical protein
MIGQNACASNSEKAFRFGDHPWRNFSVILAIVFILWLVFPHLILICIKGNSWQNTVDYGNTHGAVNSLFAGLAFAGVIVAFLLQREELELQRKELELTRTVLEEQRQQMESQAASLRKQTFEQTFLQLLKLAREVRDEAKFCGLQGAVAVNEMAKDLRGIATKCPNDELPDVSYTLGRFYNTHFIPVFTGIVEDILRLIETSCGEHKPLYFSILRASFRGGELDILFYHFCCKPGPLKSLIEEHGLLAYMEPGIPPEHCALYEPGAFEYKKMDQKSGLV